MTRAEEFRQRLDAVLAELADVLSEMAHDTEADHPDLHQRLVNELAKLTATQRRSWRAH